MCDFSECMGSAYGMMDVLDAVFWLDWWCMEEWEHQWTSQECLIFRATNAALIPPLLHVPLGSSGPSNVLLMYLEFLDNEFVTWYCMSTPVYRIG
ncbi:hypothetical protein Lal_00016614 [Lupinus albus]|nr:hypothetical protein Lal_00016614 [Lupinus albus]